MDVGANQRDWNEAKETRWKFRHPEVMNPREVVVSARQQAADHRTGEIQEMFRLVNPDDPDKELTLYDVEEAIWGWLDSNHFERPLLQPNETRRIEVVAEVRWTVDLDWRIFDDPGDDRGPHFAMSPNFTVMGAYEDGEGLLGIDMRMYENRKRVED